MTRGRARRRRVVKWTGLLVCVLFVAVYIASAWGHVFWGGSYSGQEWRWLGCVGHGGVFLGRDVGQFSIFPSGWEVESDVYAMYWWFDLEWNRLTRLVAIPQWAVLLPVGVMTTWLWWRDRHGPGRCRACGYDLAGLASDGCPECGWRRERGS